MAKGGICYTVQMGPYYDAPEISAVNGEEIGRSAPPTTLALEAGLKVVGGTDATRAGEYNTGRAIEYHITGRAVGGTVLRRNDFKLSRAHALHLYASNAVWLTFDENNRGSIEAGKYADFAVLDKPFMTMPAEEIHQLNSLLTFVGGKIVFAAAPFK